MRYLLQFWFSRQALFWLPQGWVPGYVEWLLAFPRAPKGSISIQLWGIACASVISMSSEAIVAAYVLVTKRPDMQMGKEQEPQAFRSITHSYYSDTQRGLYLWLVSHHFDARSSKQSSETATRVR
jgi:hypothetical protein